MSTWLFKIAKRTARDERKRDARYEETFIPESEVHAPLATPDRNPEEDVILKQHLRILHEVLGEMPQHLRDVLEAIELGELSFKETAELLGISERAVKDRIGKARDDFRVRFERKLRGDRRLGLLALPLMGDAFLASVQDRTAHVSSNEITGLRAIVDEFEEEPPSSGLRSSASALPAPPAQAGLPGAPAVLGKVFGAFIAGGAVGGVIVYLLMRPEPAPPAMLESGQVKARRDSVVAAGPPRASEAPQLEPTIAPSPRLPNVGAQAAVDEARARLEEALRAARANDPVRARAALSRYEREHPGNPLPGLKRQVLAVLAQVERRASN